MGNLCPSWPFHLHGRLTARADSKGYHSAHAGILCKFHVGSGTRDELFEGGVAIVVVAGKTPGAGGIAVRNTYVAQSGLELEGQKGECKEVEATDCYEEGEGLGTVTTSFSRASSLGKSTCIVCGLDAATTAFLQHTYRERWHRWLETAGERMEDEARGMEPSVLRPFIV